MIYSNYEIMVIDKLITREKKTYQKITRACKGMIWKTCFNLWLFIKKWLVLYFAVHIQ